MKDLMLRRFSKLLVPSASCHLPGSHQTSEKEKVNNPLISKAIYSLSWRPVAGQLSEYSHH